MVQSRTIFRAIFSLSLHLAAYLKKNNRALRPSLKNTHGQLVYMGHAYLLSDP
jgi:hypothetical protein